MESRVGKVPGIRARKPKAPRSPKSDIASPAALTELDVQTVASWEADALTAWPTDWQISPNSSPATGGGSESSLDQNNFTGPNTPSLFGTPSFLTPFYNIDECDLVTGYESPENEASSPMMDTLAHENTAMEDIWEPDKESEIDAQFIRNCCQMIMDLNEYLSANLKSPKIALDIVHQANRGLTHLVGVYAKSKRDNFLGLLTSLMYQIVDMLKLCVVLIGTEKHHPRRLRISPNILGTRTRFGGAATDAVQESFIIAQSVHYEIQRGLEMVATLKAIGRMDCEDIEIEMSKGDDSKTESCIKLERRLQELRERLCNIR